MNKSDDTISRQDAIEAIASRDETDGTVKAFTGREVNEILSALPSADAVEVVRCKDCKWHLNGHLCEPLSQYGSFETPPTFYCGFGERREP